MRVLMIFIYCIHTTARHAAPFRGGNRALKHLLINLKSFPPPDLLKPRLQSNTIGPKASKSQSTETCCSKHVTHPHGWILWSSEALGMSLCWTLRSAEMCVRAWKRESVRANAWRCIPPTSKDRGIILSQRNISTHLILLDSGRSHSRNVYLKRERKTNERRRKRSLNNSRRLSLRYFSQYPGACCDKRQT